MCRTPWRYAGSSVDLRSGSALQQLQIIHKAIAAIRWLFSGRGNGEHVFAEKMQLDMMPPAQPAHIERLLIAVMVRINHRCSADLAGPLAKPPRTQRLLDRKMSTVFQRICAPPMRLAGLAFQHVNVSPDWCQYKTLRSLCHLAAEEHSAAGAGFSLTARC